MKRLFKAATDRLTRTLLPGEHARREQAEYQSAAAVWNNEIQRILNKIIGESGVYVRSGPFKGMMYWPVSYPGYWSGGLTPSLLGLYERELHGTLNEVVKRDYEQVINVGCAEGYYAVGLALRMPIARVFAFDIDKKFRRLCEAMALVNGVANRVVVDGECTIERLKELTAKRTLIICDIEGGELQLLRPDLAPGLADCDLIVELHDVFHPGLTEQLVPRFASTHDIKLLRTEPRDPAELNGLDFLTAEERRLAIDERRPAAMQWAFMTSRAHSV